MSDLCICIPGHPRKCGNCQGRGWVMNTGELLLAMFVECGGRTSHEFKEENATMTCPVCGGDGVDKEATSDE